MQNACCYRAATTLIALKYLTQLQLYGNLQIALPPVEFRFWLRFDFVRCTTHKLTLCVSCVILNNSRVRDNIFFPSPRMQVNQFGWREILISNFTLHGFMHISYARALKVLY